ncbi:hypothetical protein HK097_008590 [Rhizophlyctis rosea]|uniref:Uncharacterized protein n=1 Tax=Rhizophlyctis rosea TaxID=64517 RepID=A0AAD5SDC4_9FUNG|nr:hypothetical protein HK097_008590 [Rhizophlyctis rosea]
MSEFSKSTPHPTPQSTCAIVLTGKKQLSDETELDHILLHHVDVGKCYHFAGPIGIDVDSATYLVAPQYMVPLELQPEDMNPCRPSVTGEVVIDMDYPQTQTSDITDPKPILATATDWHPFDLKVYSFKVQLTFDPKNRKISSFLKQCRKDAIFTITGILSSPDTDNRFSIYLLSMKPTDMATTKSLPVEVYPKSPLQWHPDKLATTIVRSGRSQKLTTTSPSPTDPQFANANAQGSSYGEKLDWHSKDHQTCTTPTTPAWIFRRNKANTFY